MESNPPYPESFRQALSNKLDRNGLDKLLQSSTHIPIFVYGSLMLPSVINGVIGGTGEKTMAERMLPARLAKHTRYAVEWADFPAVSPDASAEEGVDGMLVFGLSSQQRARLDRFENNLYTLETVAVELLLSDGKSSIVQAEVYIWGGDRSELADTSAKLWSIDGFLRSAFYATLSSR